MSRPTFAGVFNSLTRVEGAIEKLPHNLKESLIQAIINELDDVADWLTKISRDKQKKAKRDAHPIPEQDSGETTGGDEEEITWESEEEEQGQIPEKYLKWCGHLKTERCHHDNDSETQIIE
jgi:hypothetical protein